MGNEEKTTLSTNNEKISLKAKIAGWFKWFLLNGTYAVIVYLAIFEGKLWAVNITVFGAHLLFILSAIMAFYNTQHSEEKKKVAAKRIVPQTFNISYDLIITMVLASEGWFYSATIYFIHMIFQQSLYTKE